MMFPRRATEDTDTNAAISSSKSMQLPLVERTNALPLHEFIERYVPPDRLQLAVSKASKKADADHSNPSTAAAANHYKHTHEQQQSESTIDSHENATHTTLYTLDIHTADSIPEPDFEACFALIELTSSKDYAESSIGWSPSKKRKEMRLPDMRYILLRRGNNNDDDNKKEDSTSHPPPQSQVQMQVQRQRQRQKPLGFLSFMTTYEDNKEVLYCYEIHLHPSTQGQGLGSQLISLFEDIGNRIGLEKTMLTVFRANAAAIRFYERMGYEVDEFSPQPKRLRNGKVKEVDYLILSKRLQG
jgi:ribosomal protein S18 acetylase RimI-like enzyme